MSPETIKKNYNEKCDVWSCGVLFYLMIFKKLPFDGPTNDVKISKILSFDQETLKNSSEFQEKLSKTGQQLMLKMLDPNPDTRFSAEEAFHHVWIQKNSLKIIIDEKIYKKVLRNLLKINYERKLEEFIWIFFVNTFVDTDFEGKTEILEVFRSLDLNGDGSISRDELNEAYMRILGDRRKSIKKVDKIFRHLDTNGNGNIDFSEFLIGVLSKEKFITHKRLKIAFKILDKDNNGKISLEEFKLVFGIEGISDNDWREMINEVDGNGDGEIEFSEFEHIFSKFLN